MPRLFGVAIRIRSVLIVQIGFVALLLQRQYGQQLQQWLPAAPVAVEDAAETITATTTAAIAAETATEAASKSVTTYDHHQSAPERETLIAEADYQQQLLLRSRRDNVTNSSSRNITAASSSWTTTTETAGESTLESASVLSSSNEQQQQPHQDREQQHQEQQQEQQNQEQQQQQKQQQQQQQQQQEQQQHANVTNSNRNNNTFHRFDNVPVVVATKVLWAEQLGQLQQMVCLFHAAYNRHVNYDLVVFTTMPWTDEQVKALQDVVPSSSNVNVRVVLDAPQWPSLEEQLATMSREEIDFLYQRCNVEPGKNITWFHHCKEPGFHNVANLGYSWQSEFRAYHLFTQDILKPYKYMIWMDSDAYCTKEWSHDPIQMMVEHDLVLLMDNFPQGATKNPLILEKMERAYNKTFCHVGLSPEGHFYTKPCDGTFLRIPMVHGFHHVTNLDFFRDNLHFLKMLVESHRFSREWDDQLAVTIPPAMMAPERAWDYRMHGVHMGIQHNGRVDGKERGVANGMSVAWQKQIKNDWPVARDMCDKFVKYRDRR